MDAHPLFPVEDDDVTPEVEWVQITRFEGGRQVWAPQMFTASELQSLDDVLAKYGGGSYEIIARNRDRSRITAKRRYQLPGASIALDGTTGAPTAPAVTAPAAASTHASDNVLMAVMQMMMQSQQTTMQMMMAMVQSSKTDARSLVEMMANSSRENQRTMTEFFGRVAEMQAKGASSGGSEETLLRGMELGKELFSPGEKEEGSDLADIMTGVGQFMQLQQSTAQAAPAPAPASPPPTGAPHAGGQKNP